MSFYPSRALLVVLCSVALYARAQVPTFTSITTAGGTRPNSGNALAVDAAGNSYVAGSFGFDQLGGTIDLGNIHMVSMGGSDGFVAKFNPQGTCLWARQISGLQRDEAFGVVVLSDGSILIAGEFEGTNSIGSSTLISHGGSDIFLAAFNSAGDLQWAKAIGGTMDDFAIGLTAGVNGSAFFTGSFTGNIDLGGGIAFSSADEDAILIKLNTVGDAQWARTGTGTGSQFGSDVKVDAQGNIFWAGEFDSAISFGTTNLTSTGVNVFLAKYDDAGNRLWVRKLGSGDQAQLPRIALGADGRFLCSAVYSGQYTLAGQNLPAGIDDVLLASFDAAGNLQWVSTFGGPELNACTGLLLDASGDCYLSGYFRGAMNVGSVTLTSVGGTDVFVVRCRPDGQFEGAIRGGGIGPDVALSAAWGPSGDIRVTGSFSGTAQFGNISVTASDAGMKTFLATIAPPPRLQITAFPDYVLVRWPGYATGFNLESKTELSLPSWSPVNSAQLVNGEFVVSNHMSGPIQFFRLRK
ncbi:MAG TPA: hypothetical protein VFA77_08700 [Candidatus Eisenbacteria bacterium]|nr:hypothetical protein [Candidatus Eisenbacteria bacterium]